MQWFKRQSKLGKMVILVGVPLLFLCLCAGLASLVSPTPEETPTMVAEKPMNETPIQTPTPSSVSRPLPEPVPGPFPPYDPQLDFFELETYRDGDYVVVKGKVKNISTQTFGPFIVEVTCFDWDKQGPLETSSGSWDETAVWFKEDFLPGQVLPFKINVLDKPDFGSYVVYFYDWDQKVSNGVLIERTDSWAEDYQR